MRPGRIISPGNQLWPTPTTHTGKSEATNDTQFTIEVHRFHDKQPDSHRRGKIREECELNKSRGSD